MNFTARSLFIDVHCLLNPRPRHARTDPAVTPPDDAPPPVDKLQRICFYLNNKFQNIYKPNGKFTIDESKVKFNKVRHHAVHAKQTNKDGPEGVGAL